MYHSINLPAKNVSAENVSTINLPAISGKIYRIIETAVEILEELSKGQGLSSAQICRLEGMDAEQEPTGVEREPMDSVQVPMDSVQVPMDSMPEPMDSVPEPVDPPEKGAESKISNLFRYLTGNEGLELIRLESTGQSLLRAQGFLEEKRQALVRLARSRQADR